MFNKKELLKRPNYLLSKYQNEIYRQLVDYMRLNNLSQKDVAGSLGVSNSYISQILNGNFNFTLKKLIELGLLMGKVPSIEFVDFDEFWLRNDNTIEYQPRITYISNTKNRISVKERLKRFQVKKNFGNSAIVPLLNAEYLNVTELTEYPS
jgi:transcriptional regulator with XRE-family HTH domain